MRISDWSSDVCSSDLISIQASTSVENVNAILNISGRAQNPQIAFTSTPSLPQDEVMSRILFGESVTNLSATQAIQLAASLNSLRGGGRSEERRVGKEWVSTCRSRWSPYH